MRDTAAPVRSFVRHTRSVLHTIAMELQEHVPLREHTTLRLGGAARFFVSVRSLEELREALVYADTHALPVQVLGGGSNTFFPDAGWPGMVLHIALMGKAYEENTQGDVRALVGAGESWDAFVEDTVSQGFWGLENLSYIPGTVGATPVQNVGAYGVSVADRIDWVEVLDQRTRALQIFSSRACEFGYRDSFFKSAAGRDLIVTRVAYRLYTRPLPELSYKDLREYFGERADVTPLMIREALRTIRGRKFPDLSKVGTAGSFFKNPIVSRTRHHEMTKWLGEVPCYDVDTEHVKIPAAWLLERFGWKGKVQGHVGCHDTHALVLVHYGGGTSDELHSFVSSIVDDVKKKTSITLESEVCIVDAHDMHNVCA